MFAALPAAARDRLEEFMTTTSHRYQSEFANRYFNQGEAKGRAEGRAEGHAEGEAKTLLNILDARGIAVPDDVRTRITNCTDSEQLQIWARRAATAEKIEGLDD